VRLGMQAKVGDNTSIYGFLIIKNPGFVPEKVK
jgi:hypothetical protein